MFKSLILYATLLPGMLFAQSPSAAKTAQQPPLTVASRFDPAVYFSSVHINQMYKEGNIRTPDGMRVAYVDTIWSNSRAIAFSMQLEPEISEGWQMWLDFDADVYYRPRLVRMLAQRPIGLDKTEAFKTYREWVSTVQKLNIGTPSIDKPGEVSWPWLRRTSYYLTLKQESLDGTPWLLLVLQREHM